VPDSNGGFSSLKPANPGLWHTSGF
jgi:hypothetical protein